MHMATNFNLRLDDNLKAQSFGVIESFGMTPSQFMRLVLKQVADTGSLPLSFEKRQEHKKPSEKLLRAMAELENDDLPTYASVDDLLTAYHEKV